jgi:hypothetical protein
VPGAQFGCDCGADGTGVQVCKTDGVTLSACGNCKLVNASPPPRTLPDGGIPNTGASSLSAASCEMTNGVPATPGTLAVLAAAMCCALIRRRLR